MSEGTKFKYILKERTGKKIRKFKAKKKCPNFPKKNDAF